MGNKSEKVGLMAPKERYRKLSIRVFSNHIWKNYLTYISLKYINEDELYLEKIMKYTEDKLIGKEVLYKIIIYMRDRNYKQLRIRVYPINYDIGLASKEDLMKLINYFLSLKFEPIDNINDVTGKEAFEMIYYV